MKNITATEVEERNRKAKFPVPDLTEPLEELSKRMEEMAGLPRDNSPFVRTPGEKCMYERDFERAKKALEKANVPPPYTVIQAP